MNAFYGTNRQSPRAKSPPMQPSVVAHPLSRKPRPYDIGAIALLLDVDGTILDTASTPSSVIVPSSLRSSLEELHTRTDGALALVSGRLIRDLDVLFKPLRLPAIGGHGAEMRLASAEVTRTRGNNTIDGALRSLIAAAATSDPRVVLEDKGSSLAVHYRLAPWMEQTLRTKIASIITRVGPEDVEIMHGKAVIEIKSTHFNKGEAVLEMMTNVPFARRQPVFIGDDTTDASVFTVLPTLGGIGYSVERAIPGAIGAFDSPKDVRSWLASLVRHEERGQ